MNEIIFRFFNNLAGQSAFGDGLIIFLAKYLGWVLVAGLVIYFFRRRYRAGLYEQLLAFTATSVIAWLVAQIIKYFYASPRPFAILTDVHQLLVASSSAMPSGHASFFSALAFTLYIYDNRWGNVYLIGAVIIALGRVAAGIHWPLDILVGFALGGVVTLALRGLFLRKSLD